MERAIWLFSIRGLPGACTKLFPQFTLLTCWRSLSFFFPCYILVALYAERGQLRKGQQRFSELHAQRKGCVTHSVPDVSD